MLSRAAYLIWLVYGKQKVNKAFKGFLGKALEGVLQDILQGRPWWDSMVEPFGLGVSEKGKSEGTEDLKFESVEML